MTAVSKLMAMNRQTTLRFNSDSNRQGWLWGLGSILQTIAMHLYLNMTKTLGCHNPTANAFATFGKVIHVANVTSCIDGYVNGFKDWCGTHANDCVYAAKSGMLPIQLVTDERYHQKP